ncbi:hypothetical protein VNO77_29324 [Canavalia gladiata]|uniref:Late embryogenesis abundant protein LEA-2 subgroup domain-containing protein n=1 Tax=Canavalia gladiata TaxID=3824 RepID=A0AAN9KX05_CANGL
MMCWIYVPSSTFINCNSKNTESVQRKAMKISKAAYDLLLRKPHQHQNDIVYSRRCVLTLTCTLGLVLLLTTIYAFWPSDPDLKIVGFRLKRVKLHPLPPVTVDISMLITLRVHNTDMYSLDFGAVNVIVAYRGVRLGHVTSSHGHVRARGSSYVDADVEFSGISVLPQMVWLLEDVVKGIVPFDTVSQVRGQLGLLFFHFPMKSRLSCEVVVSIQNQTIVRQHCHRGR